MRAAVPSVVALALIAMLAAAVVRVRAKVVRAEEPEDPHPSFGELVSGPLPTEARVEAKLEIAGSVARGDMGLAEAVARFRDLHQDDPEFLEHQRCYYPNATEDELYARNVISFVRAAMFNRPADQAAAVKRLEAELARETSATGSPAAPAALP